MLGRVALGVLVLILMFAFAPAITKGVTGLRTDEIVNVVSAPTTGPDTTADVALTREVFNDNLADIESVVSTDLSDVPLATTYVYTTSGVLTVSGLEASTAVRELTIKYKSEKNDPFENAIGPFIDFLIFGGIIAAIIWSIWKGK